MKTHQQLNLLALEHMDDDALARLAQHHKESGALQILMLRHYQWMQQWAAQLVRRTRWPRMDRNDAEQDAVLALPQALGFYHPRLRRKGRKQTFRPFLQWVVQLRFFNRVRQACQDERHVNHTKDAERALDKATAERLPRHSDSILSEPADPASAAELRELLERLDAEVNRLEGRFSQLWEALCSEKRLRAVARRLPASVSSVKRWRAALVRALAARVLGCTELPR